jgi:hypothetical protein
MRDRNAFWLKGQDRQPVADGAGRQCRKVTKPRACISTTLQQLIPMPLQSKHKSRVITAHGLRATRSAPDGVTGTLKDL